MFNWFKTDKVSENLNHEKSIYKMMSGASITQN